MIQDLHFNRDFIKLDLIRHEITEGYVQYPGVCIVNLDRIDMICETCSKGMYSLHIGSKCYYITQIQFDTLCEKL
jgi:hypothetical protein